MTVRRIKGKNVSIHSDGKIYVDGKGTNLKQWKSSSTEYSNIAGSHQKDLSGELLEDALTIRGGLV